MQRFQVDVHVFETYTIRTSQASLRECWFYSQFHVPQMIVRIVLGSISPCLLFSALPPIIRDFESQFVTCIVNGCRMNFMLTLLGSRTVSKDARTRESRSSRIYLTLSHLSTIRDLSAEQLQYSYILKVVLLCVYGNYIEHANHIDGPASKIKNCSECRRHAIVY